MMKQVIQTDFDDTVIHLQQTLDSFDQKALNTVPFTGSWKAGQVALHVLKSQSMASELLNGKTNATKRDPYEKIQIVKKIFLDFTTKLTSPEMILPSNEVQEKPKLISDLKTVATKITSVIQTQDLSATCIDFALPNIGEMTRAEWIYFIIYHTQRHIHQLKSISQKLLSETVSVH